MTDSKSPSSVADTADSSTSVAKTKKVTTSKGPAKNKKSAPTKNTSTPKAPTEKSTSPAPKKSTASSSKEAASTTKKKTSSAKSTATPKKTSATKKVTTSVATKKPTPAKQSDAPKETSVNKKEVATRSTVAEGKESVTEKQATPKAGTPPAKATSTSTTKAESTTSPAKTTKKPTSAAKRTSAAKKESASVKIEEVATASKTALPIEAKAEVTKSTINKKEAVVEATPEIASQESSREATDKEGKEATSAPVKEKTSSARGRKPSKYNKERPVAKKEEMKQLTGDTKKALPGVSHKALPAGSEGNAEVELEETTASSKEQSKKLPRRKMFVSVLPGEQIEVILTEEGQVLEYYVEMLQQAKTKGNIYKGVIHNVDASLQAAFINYGAQKNGFLQIDEVHPEYYNVPQEEGKGRRYPPMQKVLKAGQEVLVQVVKEPTGSKGAFLTTYLSLPGRFLVLTPGREQIGISRKVDNESERTRLRGLLEGLKPGPGLGVIVRTVSMGTTKTILRTDLRNLEQTWAEVRTRGTSEPTPSLIYKEIDLTTRAVRDYLTDQVCEVWIDDQDTANAVDELAKDLFPKKGSLVHFYKESTETLFERFNLQRQLDQIYAREVVLPSGGRLIIDPTEALTAIDINSGRTSGKTNFEDMAYRTNLEAARMIPLQLRLRDIGGQVVCDFIEMREKKHWREVEKTLRANMKGDRARYDVGRISSFGLLELVRQRLGSSAISVSTEVCPHCKGAGVRRNVEWQTQQALKDIVRKIRVAKEQKIAELVYAADEAVAMHLLNSKRPRLVELEEHTGIKLKIVFAEK